MRRIDFTREYIEAKTEKIPFAGCWLWTGALNMNGYGRLRARGSAQRGVWELYNGSISPRLILRHTCGVRSCVNPAHLFTATKRDVVVTHGLTRSPEYNSWTGMRNRCRKPSDVAYKYYGARGVSVCARWESFENFLADMGERPKGMSLDRINSLGNYEPSNCRWATTKQQHENRVLNR